MSDKEGEGEEGEPNWSELLQTAEGELEGLSAGANSREFLLGVGVADRLTGVLGKNNALRFVRLAIKGRETEIREKGQKDGFS